MKNDFDLGKLNDLMNQFSTNSPNHNLFAQTYTDSVSLANKSSQCNSVVPKNTKILPSFSN